MAKQQTPYRMTPITAIQPYDKNPRIIPQAAVDAVVRSIQAFGFRSPIIVDRDGVILAGHTRYKAAQQLGLNEVPVVWQTDITDIQARGYRIADNKVAEISAWDRDALDAEVRELAGLGGDLDLSAVGLADWELERILHDDTDDPIGAPEDCTPPATARGFTPYQAEGLSLLQSKERPEAITNADEQEPQPDIKDRVLSIYYSDKELALLADALGVPEQAVSRRRAYTVTELLRERGQQDGSTDDA